MTVLVTGGAGFIGLNFVHDLLAAEPDTRVVVLDKLTYAANAEAVREIPASRFAFYKGDVCDRTCIRTLLDLEKPDAIVHFAAETHVDRSINAPTEFMMTNVMGTFALLEECRRIAHDFRFVHVSTDEVFGALGPTGTFTEESRYAPKSPYAASKAGSDHLVAAYVHTYGFPAITTNCTNNYGPYQYPEKLIPLMIATALDGGKLPVYGAGDNVRDWIHVSDHCAAVRAVLRRGRIGDTYLVGARNEVRNIDLVHQLCELLDELAPAAASYQRQIGFVADRPGHDFRYAIDPAKLERELGWAPRVAFVQGLRDTVAWFVQRRRNMRTPATVVST
jgi:dTDP-glucose 4,6-dehydratase